MNFEATVRLSSAIEYGFFKGGGRIVFIKAGLGGSCFGDENKYLKMAAYLRDLYHCSVIVASNPNDGKDHTHADRRIIEQFVADNGDRTPELLFFGNSNGGFKGLALAADGVYFRKMILVNMPLMINLHKTKRHIESILETEVLAVYGERDPSYSYVPFIDGKYDNLHVLRIPGADHNFKGRLDEFLHLSDLLFTSYR